MEEASESLSIAPEGGVYRSLQPRRNILAIRALKWNALCKGQMTTFWRCFHGTRQQPSLDVVPPGGGSGVGESIGEGLGPQTFHFASVSEDFEDACCLLTERGV